MSEIPERVVIRAYAPVRRRLLFIGLALLLLLALYASFEFGRYRAGFDQLAVTRERAAERRELRELQGSNRELRVQMAALEASRLGQARERAEVARNIGELQAQLARQSQDLAFYRGIVGKSSEAPAVKIQQFRLVTLDTPQRYTMRIVLGRPVRPEDQISGTLAVTVDGSEGEGEEVAAYDLAKLTPDKKRELRYSFQYLETIEQELSLPAQFNPARVTVELRSNRGLSPIRETFLWAPVPPQS